MHKLGLTAVLLVALQACQPVVPASNAGPGFQTATQFEQDRARRDAALAGNATSTFSAPSSVQTGAIGSTDLAAVGIGAAPLPATNVRSGGLDAMPSNPAPTAANNSPSISDENSFSAVTGRESIESDAQRRAAQAAARQEIQPTALPTRPSNAGPNIVEYALNAPNVKGQEWYSRSIFATQARFQRNCVKYRSADAAQRDFLANGGPERDRRGIDPDGDGFACGWDPAPFKRVALN